MVVRFNNILGRSEEVDLTKHGSFSFNADCMEFLRNCPDKAFDLCVCDPPYGDGSSQSVNVERERDGRATGV